MLRALGRSLVIGVGFLVVVAALVLWRDPQLRHKVWAELTHDIGEPDETWEPAPLVSGSVETRFAVIGDIGTGEPEAYRTGEVVDEFEEELEFDAVLLLGDNVYPDGDPDLLRRTVYAPLGGVLDAPTQLLAILGNHDVRDGNGDGQVERLGMPGRWYSTVIDDTLVVALDSTEPGDPDQRAWLDAELAAADQQWIIVIVHHPPYSGGYHGSEIEVREAFGDLFEEHGVDLVLAGHEHDYQRTEEIGGVVYVVSGGAAHLRPAARTSFTETAWSTLHFVDLAVHADRIEGRAVDQSGRVFDEFVIRG